MSAKRKAIVGLSLWRNSPSVLLLRLPLKSTMASVIWPCTLSQISIWILAFRSCIFRLTCCRDLGMVFTGLVFPLKRSKPCSAACPRSPSSAENGEENWVYKRWRSQVEIRAIYWKQRRNTEVNSNSSSIDDRAEQFSCRCSQLYRRESSSAWLLRALPLERDPFPHAWN